MSWVCGVCVCSGKDKKDRDETHRRERTEQYRAKCVSVFVNVHSKIKWRKREGKVQENKEPF